MLAAASLPLPPHAAARPRQARGLTHAYLKDRLFISAASFSNFSITRLSMPPSL